MFRSITFLCLLLVCDCTIAAAQETPEVTTAKPQADPNAIERQATVKAYFLKYAKADAVLQAINQLGLEARIAADQRLNALYAQAPEDVHGQIMQFLKTIDSQNREGEVTTIVQESFLPKEGGSTILSQVAKQSGVDIAFDKDLGVVMLKGDASDIARAQTVINKIREVSVESTRLRAEPIMLRILWLSNDPTEDFRNPFEPDEALTKSIEKLAELGYPKMTVKMQLLGRVDFIEDKASCRVEGTLQSGNTRRTLSADATLANSSHLPFQGKFTLSAGVTNHPNLDGTPERACVDVSIALSKRKYYILSATPVGGYQTAFVVQVIDDL